MPILLALLSSTSRYASYPPPPLCSFFSLSSPMTPRLCCSVTVEETCSFSSLRESTLSHFLTFTVCIASGEIWLAYVAGNQSVSSQDG